MLRGLEVSAERHWDRRVDQRGLRLCPHSYNTRAHILRAIDEIASMRDLIRA